MKVGSERKFASADKSAKIRQTSVSSRSVVFIVYFARGDPPDRWFSLSILVPKRTLSTGGICPPRSMVFIVLFENARQSDAQLLLIIVHRSNVFIYYFFAPGPPKPSRNRPETARVQNRYFSKGFQLKIDGFSIPGRSRPGPALKIDAFLKDFN